MLVVFLQLFYLLAGLLPNQIRVKSRMIYITPLRVIKSQSFYKLIHSLSSLYLPQKVLLLYLWKRIRMERLNLSQSGSFFDDEWGCLRRLGSMKTQKLVLSAWIHFHGARRCIIKINIHRFHWEISRILYMINRNFNKYLIRKINFVIIDIFLCVFRS